MWTAPEVTVPDEPFVGNERTMVDGWLARVRATLLAKCAGLTGEQLALCSVEPATMSLLGLVRHLTDVERTWFRRRLRGLEIPSVHWRQDSPDAAFDEADPARAERDYAALVAEQEAASAAALGLPLDTTFTHRTYGEMSLRWLYHHLLREYAQHNGHADLLRERIDGVTG